MTPKEDCMTPNDEKWIDNSSYEDLLRRWRFAGTDDDIFTGESGAYYAKRMHRLKKQMSNEAAVKASKTIGWG